MSDQAEVPDYSRFPPALRVALTNSFFTAAYGHVWSREDHARLLEAVRVSVEPAPAIPRPSPPALVWVVLRPTWDPTAKLETGHVVMPQVEAVATTEAAAKAAVPMGFWFADGRVFEPEVPVETALVGWREPPAPDGPVPAPDVVLLALRVPVEGGRA